ncbi:A/G-specific adenine glycosylase [Marinilabilia rubra]|uniref:Adenine DNA glycosylase n=2 Tax=Marinilabilia rubra TaxID=2162893 RepID=A0A2U2BDX7_9BACT|nr:A/G-specific adenine glycosylase [Marinilabilia rubra]
MTNFPKLIREWYCENGRQLPWRETKDPYKIWISEIILQQTQVKQGLEYYRNFIKRFPDVQTLARATETELMQQWQGLGYYSRARNIHHAAKAIINEHNGLMPQTYKKIRTLKGVGPYTAAAIASFAFRLPYPVVDGNVYRLLSRLFAKEIPIDSTEGKKYFYNLADNLLDRADPATHNQAIMEMGALICKPANPKCDECPVVNHCKAYGTKSQNRFPVKQKKIIRKKRFFNYLIIIKGNKTIVQKRAKQDIWQGLYQFPLLETSKRTPKNKIVELIEEGTGVKVTAKKAHEKKHLLTHQELHAVFYRIKWPTTENLPEFFDEIATEEIKKEDVPKIPFPQLIRENLKNIL